MVHRMTLISAVQDAAAAPIKIAAPVASVMEIVNARHMKTVLRAVAVQVQVAPVMMRYLVVSDRKNRRSTELKWQFFQIELFKRVQPMTLLQ